MEREGAGSTMLKKMLAATTLVISLGLVAAACGDDEPKTSPGGADGSTAADGSGDGDESSSPSAEDVRAFFEALASENAATMESATGLAAPGSLAALYLQHQTALSVALRDGGSEPYEAERLEEKGDGFESCSTTEGKESCATYAAIQTRGSQVASFTIDGKDLRGRLLAGGKKWFKAGDLAEVRLVTAYEALDGTLFVTLDLRNVASRGTVSVESRTAYRTKEGRQVQLGGQSGPTSVQADSMAHIAVAFAAADLGGDLNLELFQESGGTGSASLKIPLR